ncbi:YbhB/YbcL family Raf kinase inhibitor-like protein [Catenulispora subtropica]|uniref:PEBP family protein n=1 Tax=Catenulispora subtropica TaxID=450798 RepID=A0ABP5E905_9ACTN
MSWKFRRPRRRAAVALSAALVLSAAGTATALAATASHPKLTPMLLSSPDFKDGGKLPSWTVWGKDPACPGKNLAPALKWVNPPAGTKGFAVTVTDVDTPMNPGFTHWVVYNIPGNVSGLAGHGSNPYSEGVTDYDGVTTGYAGPCPPPTGQPHHYVFRVWALDIDHVDGNNLDYATLINEITPHMLWSASMVGTVRFPTADS